MVSEHTAHQHHCKTTNVMMAHRGKDLFAGAPARCGGTAGGFGLATLAATEVALPTWLYRWYGRTVDNSSQAILYRMFRKYA
jgi:hypothetical protein